MSMLETICIGNTDELAKIESLPSVCLAKTILEPILSETSALEEMSLSRLQASKSSRIGAFAATAAKDYDIHLLPWAFVVACLSDSAAEEINNQNIGFGSEALEEEVVPLPKVPERCQLIDEEQAFGVMVDYAHTPDTLSRLLDTVRELSPWRIITVIGCGRDRDKGKRPMMAKIAMNKSDVTMLKLNNPRTEDPCKSSLVQEINNQNIGFRSLALEEEPAPLPEALMALYFSSVTLPSSKFPTNLVSNHVFQKSLIITKCEQTNDSSELSADQNSTLKIGSAIIVVDAPKTIKTAASIPCLRVNTDLVKTGDVGRLLFEGIADLESFLKMCQKLGFLVMLRPGPYICAEWDFRGFPAWMFSTEPALRLRSSDPAFLHLVDRWWGMMLPKIASLLYSNEGPIIMV
ncbi:hypothetical protein IFM89_000432 [Coptis chinensis]|uniref:beta-galactosidase n=1 Tax=Coptis chinensis TaxID=261450 RepID=A0A835I6J8_9MAGN|nr:hypothetical protein IFM89_000432 [Coptis chinensis]